MNDLNLEAKMLSIRTGLKASACKAWMKEQGLQSILDLKALWPELDHSDCMSKAAVEVERYILFKE